MEAKSLRPTYYNDFKCSGGDCRYTCCARWGIQLNKKDYDAVRNARMPKELRAVVNNVFRRNKGETHPSRYARVDMRSDGEQYCPLLSEEHMCMLQVECGYETLNHTCKKFPRSSIHVGGTNFEEGIGIGCEEVVSLLMRQTEGVAFENTPFSFSNMAVTRSIEKSKDNPFYPYYWDIKLLGIGILQAQGYSMDDRMLLLGNAFKGLINLENEGRVGDIPEFVDNMLASVEQLGLMDAFNDLSTNPADVVVATLPVFSKINRVPSELEYQNRIFAGLGIDELTLDEEGCLSVILSNEQYANAVARREKFLENHLRIMENIMVNEFHRQAVPIDTDFNLWDSYIRLVYLYLLIKLSVAGYLDEDLNESDFCHAVMMIGRCFVHSESAMKGVAEFIKKNESATLAHLALLIKA